MSIFDLSMFNIRPKADERFTVTGGKYRFTVLTDRMLRLEYSEDGVFEDRATRLAFNRSFDTPEYEVYEERGMLHLRTKHLHLCYDKEKFSEEGLRITVDGTKHWLYGQTPPTMPGTVRTLDGVNGACTLGPSVLNRSTGIAVLDDSSTLVIGEDGWPVPSAGDRCDLYFFGYFQDYAGAIRDFYRLSAPMPLIPRYALGNWWSRYHKYSQEEYLSLMDKFKEKALPFSVAVIDMDWHITATPDPVRFGSGWTGYSWNRALFPDPEGFLADLHKRGLAASLNLHPRDGIRAYEDVYPALCERLGLDPAEGKQIEFDASSKEFMEAYFDTVLDPMEESGVDFWWIDWQQSGGARTPGYDVLWMLNHCHYVDNARDGKRPLLFSRYAGIGSHRYPLGFSGDTHITWESLDFQPYFTAMASNLGFSMWSHDIGGHFHGFHDSELYTRWLQLGVFSPINRLHSSPSLYMSKEPWNYGAEAERIAGEFLRLRHALIPYIYTAHYKNHTEGTPLVRPAYFLHPKDGDAYMYKNQYYFGDELLVAPITSKRDADSLLAKTTLWMPDGVWIDFFSGRIYRGKRTVDIYRHLGEMPVFARAGSIIPLALTDSNDTAIPAALELRVFGGADGRYTLIEDNDRLDRDLDVSETRFSFEYGDTPLLRIESAEARDYLPERREYHVSFAAFERPAEVTLTVAGSTSPLSFEYDERTKTVKCAPVTVEAGGTAEISVAAKNTLPDNEIGSYVREAILSGAHLSIDECGALTGILARRSAPAQIAAEILTRPGNEYLKGYIVELLCAK